MLDTYQDREDLTLEQLKIYPMKTLALESRKSPNVHWEPYDPNLMEIRLTPWQPDIIEKFQTLPDFTEKNAQRVKICREMKMSDFKVYVEKTFGLENAVIMRRTPMMQNQAVEVLSENVQKGLNELRVNEGINLYVEESGGKKWETEFELETNRY